MKTYFFSGIGGIGMSALARLLHARGHRISGSDATDSELLAELEREGMEIFREQKAENIPPDAAEFIYSEAIPEDHPERRAAENFQIEAFSYFRKLGQISQDFFTICVAGTHGKSSTTALTGLALEAAGLDPTVVVGTKIFEWGNKNFRAGKSEILLVEACEYRESFLFLKTDIILLTNVEPEHLDYYKTPENYFRGFRKFLGKLDESGILIANFTDPEIREVAREHHGREIFAGEFLEHVPELSVKGEHQRQNASKVLALFKALNLNLQVAQQSLQNYRGAWRRFEVKGEKNGVTVIDDYGHHPTEIRATLQALAESYPQRKKWVVFQPHQYSRTFEFLSEFGKSFAKADEVLIPDIYRVRDTEEDVRKISPEKLVAEIRKNLHSGQQVRHTENFAKAVEILQAETKPGDVVLTIGAGPVNEVGEEFLRNSDG